MRFKCPFVLFKKTLRSGKKVWYYYFYNEYNKRHQFSTGCTIKAQAEAVCMELYRTGVMIPTVKNPLALLSSRPLDQHGFHFGANIILIISQKKELMNGFPGLEITFI